MLLLVTVIISSLTSRGRSTSTLLALSSFPLILSLIGQGGASPSVVADAMVEAVVDFVKKKHPASVHTVKILIFQTTMVPNFHQSMMKRQGEQMDKGLIGRIRGIFFSSKLLPL